MYIHSWKWNIVCGLIKFRNYSFDEPYKKCGENKNSNNNNKKLIKYIITHYQ